MARIVRVPIYHEGTFRAVLLAALRARRCLRHGGRYWEPIEARRGFGLYCRATYDLTWIQQRVEGYELFFYTRLLQCHFSRDGTFRSRTRLLRGPSGAYRRSEQVERRGR